MQEWVEYLWNWLELCHHIRIGKHYMLKGKGQREGKEDVKINHFLFFSFIKYLISGWALNALQCQLCGAILGFWTDPLHSSHIYATLNEWLSLYTEHFCCCCWIATEVVYLQCCLIVTWLVPCETAAVSAHILCTQYNHAPYYIIILFEVIYLYGACVFSCNLPPTLLVEWLRSCACYCSNTG